MSASYNTAEAAALAGFAPGSARVLGCAISPQGFDAAVLVGTNEPPDLYPYLVLCHRDDAGWTEGNSSNGDMWFATGQSPDGLDIGGLAVWDAAPPGVRSARLRFQGTLLETPVVRGYYLFVAWDVPADTPWPVLETHGA